MSKQNFPLTKAKREDAARKVLKKFVEAPAKEIVDALRELTEKAYLRIYGKQLELIEQAGVEREFFNWCNSFTLYMQVNGEAGNSVNSSFAYSHSYSDRDLQGYRVVSGEISTAQPKLHKVFPMPMHRSGLELDALETEVARKLLKDASKLVKEAQDFHRDTLAVLNSCKNYRQLEELNATLAGYIEKPEPKVQAPVPVDVANSVAERLNKAVAA